MIVYVIGEWRSAAFRGLAALTFGVLTLIWPDLSLRALVWLYGAYVIVDGVSVLINVVSGKAAPWERRAWLILLGVVSILAGLVTFVWPEITALALLGVIAGWALITGCMEIALAVRLRREIPDEWLLAATGVLSVGLAILLLIAPGAGALAITWAIGWFAVLFGVLNLALAWRLHRLQARAERPRRSRTAPQHVTRTT